MKSSKGQKIDKIPKAQTSKQSYGNNRKGCKQCSLVCEVWKFLSHGANRIYEGGDWE